MLYFKRCQDGAVNCKTCKSSCFMKNQIFPNIINSVVFSQHFNLLLKEEMWYFTSIYLKEHDFFYDNSWIIVSNSLLSCFSTTQCWLCNKEFWKYAVYIILKCLALALPSMLCCTGSRGGRAQKLTVGPKAGEPDPTHKIDKCLRLIYIHFLRGTMDLSILPKLRDTFEHNACPGKWKEIALPSLA